MVQVHWTGAWDWGADLQVPALGLEPVLDEVLGVVAEAQHEVSLGLQLVDGLDGLVDLNRGTQRENKYGG